MRRHSAPGEEGKAEAPEGNAAGRGVDGGGELPAPELLLIDMSLSGLATSCCEPVDCTR